MAEPASNDSKTDRAAENGRRAAELYTRMNGGATKDTEAAQRAMSEHFLRMNDPAYAAEARRARRSALDVTRGLPASTTEEQAKALRDRHLEKVEKATQTHLEKQRAGARIYQTPSAEQQSNMAAGLGYGALAGGGLGLLYEALREKSPEEKKQTVLHKVLRYAAKGGIGALAGGAVGRRIGGSMSLTKTSAAFLFSEKVAVNTRALLPLLTGAKAVIRVPSFVSKTFKPGFRELRQTLRDTARVYAAQDPPLRTAATQTNRNISPLFRYTQSRPALARRAKALDNWNIEGMPETFGGAYSPSRNVAAVNAHRGKLRDGTANGLMRHELLHAHQNAAPNLAIGAAGRRNPWRSLPALAGRLEEAGENTWRRGLGSFLKEINAYAGMNRGTLPQIRGALKYIYSPEQLEMYTKHYGGKYGLIHAGTAVAPFAAGSAALGTAGAAYGAARGSYNR